MIYVRKRTRFIDVEIL